MSHAMLDKGIDSETTGTEMFDCIARLYPICRSITGDGVRATLKELQSVIPLTVHEVPSGTTVHDWTVPDEWNVQDAWVKNAAGERVIDFRDHNLHLVNYSVPVQARMSLQELRPHLHTLPSQPERIPYRTAYYAATWGFCLSQQQLDDMPEGEYEVGIDSTLAPGNLTYGELHIPGRTSDEVLVSCHVCHPSLANDNLSGIAVAAFLARHLQSLSAAGALRLSYRILFVPATIGSLTWLSRNPEAVANIRHGLCLAGLGDDGHHTYKRSRRGSADIDRAAAQVLARQEGHEVLPFTPYGYDERQYCSPGYNLPVGRLTRTPHGEYPEYHTDADNLDLVGPAQLAGSLSTCLEIFEVLEQNRRCLNLKPFGEPQLGKYGLYDAIGGDAAPDTRMALLWVLNLSDGRHSLLEIAERSQIDFGRIAAAAAALEEAGLLGEAD